MKRKILILSALLLAAIATTVSAKILFTGAATDGTLECDATDYATHTRIYTLTAVSNSSGAVTKDMPSITGTITKITTDPGDGADEPTTLYDIRLLDVAGINLFASYTAAGSPTHLGDNRSATASEVFVPMLADSTMPMKIVGPTTLQLTDMGNAKKTVIRIEMEIEPERAG